MARDRRIGFLGGGNMAEAIIRGLLADENVPAENIGVSEPQVGRRTALVNAYGVRTESDNLKIAGWADIIVLAVKPQIAPAVLDEIRGQVAAPKLVVSVAAGLTTESIETALGGETRVVRTMPNTPTLVRAGATAVCAGAHASADDVDTARAIFDSVGITEVVKEAQIDAITGLSGSGPAYAFVFLEAMADAGVKMGLARPTALKFAAQTLMGSARLLLETDGHPGELKDMVTSPGGTTIAGVHALEAGGFRTTLINAVEAATRRANELGKEP